MKPLLAAAATEVADDLLVAAVRDGSEEAFEALYRRYRVRIVGYVRSMCGDHARAEDIAQEAFMSALRGLRSSEKEIVFRPWLYEIAKNACIDHMRRGGRGAEVSIDSEDFSAQEEGRISQSVSGTDAEVARRKELESLQMAFGDLPESQHQILVMREFEGLSYDRIGSRMGLSRGAVESLLFRARRTLRDGFDEIDTGERCVRMQIAMEATADGLRTGMRDRRRLTSHLRDCAACRRMAVTIGLDELALAAARDRGRALRRLAGFLPLPMFLKRRIGDGGGLMSSFGPAAEQGVSLAGKATAVVIAAAVAAGGAGVATKASGGSLGLPGPFAGSSGAEHGGSGPGDAGRVANGGGAGTAAAGAAARTAAGTATGGGAPAAQQERAGGRDGSGSGSSSGQPAGAVDLQGSVDRTTGTVSDTVGGTSGPVGSAVGTTGKTVDRTVERVGGVVDQTLQDVTGDGTTRLPKPKLEVPDTGVELPSTDGGGSTTLPSTGTLDSPELTVQTPGVQVPNTGVNVPGPSLRLP